MLRVLPKLAVGLTVAAILFASAGKAEAGLLIEFTYTGTGVGTITQDWFVNTGLAGVGTNTLVLSNFSIGHLTGALNATTSNAPGGAILGYVQNAIDVGQWDVGAGENPTLTIFSQVKVNSSNTVKYATPQLVTGADLTEIQSLALFRFTLPNGPPFLVGADVSSSGPLGGPVVATTRTDFDNSNPPGSSPVTVDSGIDVNGSGSNKVTQVVTGGLSTYTLSSTLNISPGANSTSYFGSLTGRSEVAAVVPEPSTVVPALLGVFGLILARGIRRHREQ